MDHDGCDLLFVSVRWWGARGDGVTDDTAAIRAAVAAAAEPRSDGGAGGRVVFFPPGTYLVSRTIHVTSGHTHLRGSGIYASVICYRGTGAVFQFTADPASSAPPVLHSCSVSDLAFSAKDQPAPPNPLEEPRIAIRCVNTCEMKIEKVYVNDWSGARSIGIQLAGRERTLIRRTTVFADRPISIENNPSSKLVDADQYHFQDLYLDAQDSSESCIVFLGGTAPQRTGLVVTNFLLDGSNSLAGGLHGICLDDSKVRSNTEGGACRCFRISNIRRDLSALGQVGYCVYFKLHPQRALHAVELQNVAADPYVHGFFLRGVHGVALRHCIYAGFVGATIYRTDAETEKPATAFNVDGSCHDVSLDSTFFQAGCNLQLGGDAPRNSV